MILATLLAVLTYAPLDLLRFLTGAETPRASFQTHLKVLKGSEQKVVFDLAD